jgi:hypothetical protein
LRGLPEGVALLDMNEPPPRGCPEHLCRRTPAEFARTLNSILNNLPRMTSSLGAKELAEIKTCGQEPPGH